MKRLRKKYGSGIRFFMCGEYGDRFSRPHYHACIFNFDFTDKYLWKLTPSGERLYRSPSFEELWPYGHSSVGCVTFESAAYVARYVTKKITGKLADVIRSNGLKYYERLDESTGEIIEIQPEYTRMSLRPGIASDWFDKFSSDVYPSDYIVLRGVKMKPPRFYDSRYELLHPEDLEVIKDARLDKAYLHVEDNTRERLIVRENVQNARFKMLKRDLEEDDNED